MASETGRPQAETRGIFVKGQLLRVVIRKGDGASTPLLMMNGIGVNLEVLQPFVDALNPAIEVIRFDVPGTGGSPAPRIPYTLSMHARLAAQILDQLGYGQVDVLGISWGGALAQQFAFQYPARCRRLVLVSTGTGAFMIPGRPSALVKLATPRRYRDPAYLERIAGEIYGGKMRTRPDLAREFARMASVGSALGYFYQMLGATGWTSLPWLHRLKQPTLILHGDDDPLVPLVNAKIMHRLIYHSKLYIFHDGHLGLGTSARELAQVVDKFLAAPAASSSDQA
ncbi:MAG TPA: poly(3-hydroxyalkanoate) depolymerase [Ktedonobacteraceae bacterium]|nr:poly(3-hydroxyalkanoate) depolymerase [Ktedonobacteraceae bacterium]